MNEYAVDEISLDALDVLDELCETSLLEESIPVAEQISPPYFVVKNVAFNEELPYYLSETGFPVYYSNGVTFTKLGYMHPTIESVQRARFLDTRVYYVSHDGKEQDLSETDNLLAFLPMSLAERIKRLSEVEEL